MKLILFDIDGTLIRHAIKHTAQIGGWPRFIYAAKKVYGVQVNPNTTNYNGWVDREILLNLVSEQGISKPEFTRKFPFAIDALHEYALKQDKQSFKLYEKIPEAEKLVQLVSLSPNYQIGILTGNVRKITLWKLVHSQIDLKYFKLFLTGDEVDDRISLAKTVFSKALEVFGENFLPQELVIIGDAIGDVRCAKAIGASVVIVLTGGHNKSELEKEKPDLLVDSLIDPQVLKFLDLKHINMLTR